MQRGSMRLANRGCWRGRPNGMLEWRVKMAHENGPSSLLPVWRTRDRAEAGKRHDVGIGLMARRQVIVLQK